jgi:hypothetical protein
MSYYDVDDILAENIPVVCTFRCDVYGMAELDPSGDDSQLDVREDPILVITLYLIM